MTKSPDTEWAHRPGVDSRGRRLRLVTAPDDVPPPAVDSPVTSALRLVGGLVTVAGDVVVALTMFAAERLAAGLPGDDLLDTAARPVRRDGSPAARGPDD